MTLVKLQKIYNRATVTLLENINELQSQVTF